MSDRDALEKKAFKAAIRAEGLDSGPTRLIYADWLSDHGMDDEAELQRRWTVGAMKDAIHFIKDFVAMAILHTDMEEDPPVDAGHRISDDALDEFIAGVDRWLDGGESVEVFAYWPSDEQLETFWRHFQVYTGRPVLFDDPEESDFTGCTCSFPPR